MEGKKILKNVLIVIGVLCAIGGIAYAIYKYFHTDYEDEFLDDVDDAFDDEDEELFDDED